MLLTVVVLAVVTIALIAGAAWGAYANISSTTEGFLVATAGGALIVAIMNDMVLPATEVASLWSVAAAVAAGAVVFTACDTWVERRSSGSVGFGLLLAVTLDGVPENMALGVSLIGADFAEVAALAGAILLSNLPEAAGGAARMREDGMAPARIMALWGGTAVLLVGAGAVGHLALGDASDQTVSVINCLAAGAVVASLATTVFPQAFRKDQHLSGIAVAVGLVLAVVLGNLG